MPPDQTSRRRFTTPWRFLLLGSLLAVPAAAAQPATPGAAMADTPAPQASPRPAEQQPAAGEETTPAAPQATPPAEAAGPQDPSPLLEGGQTPPSEPSPQKPAAAAPTRQEIRRTAPSRAPGATREDAPARRRQTQTAPQVAPPERPAAPPGMGTASPEAEWSPPEEDFGRWERNSQQCEIQVQEPRTSRLEPLPCRGVRLDQQLAGLLSIRFLPATGNRAATEQQLLFAGVLLRGSEPMRCRNGRCEPSWPIRVQLSALATSHTRSLGLPDARVVQGSCSLEQARVLCHARDREGRRWQATARW